jgi:hypothetical protein
MLQAKQATESDVLLLCMHVRAVFGYTTASDAIIKSHPEKKKKADRQAKLTLWDLGRCSPFRIETKEERLDSL